MTSSARTPSEAFWETHYQGTPPSWGTRPNAALIDVINGLNPPPGRCVDLACGQGGDAIWLASLGWHVTAVDVSATALDRVTTVAVESGVADRVVTAQHDLSATLPTGAFDLVYACYFHSPLDIPRDEILGRAAALVGPGGLFVVVDHASTAPWSWNAGSHHRFPLPEETLAGLRLDAGWRVERLAASQRTAVGPGGQTATVTDNTIVVRRSPR